MSRGGIWRELLQEWEMRRRIETRRQSIIAKAVAPEIRLAGAWRSRGGAGHRIGGDEDRPELNWSRGLLAALSNYSRALQTTEGAAAVDGANPSRRRLR